MKELLKDIIKKTPFYIQIRKWFLFKKQKREIIEWEKNGKPNPPPHIIKQLILRSYKEKFKLKILVETGTYYGDMVEAMKNDFDKIYSIELSKELFNKAKKRFKGENKISLIHGDSATEIKKVVDSLKEPALFWLDGHYSGGETAKGDKYTPLYEELMHIFNAKTKGHVILIDDARCLGRNPDYPLIEELLDFIKSKESNVDITIENDIIRITPRK